MLLFHDCRFMLYLLFCLISSCWQIFVLFFHIKSFQDTCITKPDGRSFILSNPHRDVDDTAFPSCSVLYIIFPLAFFQKRLINKPLFHLFSLSQNDHKDSKVKLHFKKKKSWVCFLWQKTTFVFQSNVTSQLGSSKMHTIWGMGSYCHWQILRHASFVKLLLPELRLHSRANIVFLKKKKKWRNYLFFVSLKDQASCSEFLETEKNLFLPDHSYMIPWRLCEVT